MLPLLRCFFAHLLILQYPDHHQNLISSSLYYSGPVHKISSQSVHNFLSNVVHRQTITNATKNITSFAKEVTIYYNIQFPVSTVSCLIPQTHFYKFPAPYLPVFLLGRKCLGSAAWTSFASPRPWNNTISVKTVCAQRTSKHTLHDRIITNIIII